MPKDVIKLYVKQKVKTLEINRLLYKPIKLLTLLLFYVLFIITHTFLN